MKKTKFILLSLVAAMILMGAGYAAWSQSFTITSTVSTGELFVDITNDGITDIEVIDSDGSWNPVNEKNEDQYYLDVSAFTAEATKSGSSGAGIDIITDITYTLPEIYPGTKVTSQITFENKGTMKTQTSGTGKEFLNSALWNDLVITVNSGEAIEGEGQTKLDNLANAIAEAVGELDTTGDNKSEIVTIVQELPITSENDTENIELADGVTWQVELQFEQYNAQNTDSEG